MIALLCKGIFMPMRGRGASQCPIRWVRVYTKQIEEKVKTVAAIAKYSVILDTTTLTLEIYTRSACRADYVYE